MIGISLFLVAVIGGYAVFLFTLLMMKSDLETTKKQVLALQPVVSRVERIRNERREMEVALEEYRSLREKQLTWSHFLFELNNITPVDVWLSSLEIGAQTDKSHSGSATQLGAGKESEASGSKSDESKLFSRPGVMMIKGYSRTVSSIGIFIRNLNQLTYFKEVVITKVASEDAGISFECKAFLKE